MRLRKPLSADIERADRRSRPMRRGMARHAIAACLVVWAMISAAFATSSPNNPYGDYIAEAAQRFSLPASWIRAVMRAESGFDPKAISDKGAQGLMQIMPRTWDVLRAQYELDDDPFAPRDNILAGAGYLRAMLDRYGSAELMLAAYHAGPGRTDDHVKDGRALPASTRAYIATVLPHLVDAPGYASADEGWAETEDPTGARLYVNLAGTTAADITQSEPGLPEDGTEGGAVTDDPTGGIFAARKDASGPSAIGALAGTRRTSNIEERNAPDVKGDVERTSAVVPPPVNVVTRR